MNAFPSPTGILDLPNELLQKIAKAIPDRKKGWNLQGLAANKRLNEIRKIAQYEFLSIEIVDTTLHSALLHAVISILHDDHNVQDYVRHLTINGQLGPRENPDDVPYFRTSTFEVAQTLLHFTRTKSLTLDSFIWTAPSPTQRYFLHEDGLPTFPTVTTLVLDEAATRGKLHFPFDLLQMFPNITTLTVSLSVAAEPNTPSTPSIPAKRIKHLTLRGIQYAHTSTYSALISAVQSSLLSLQIDWADLKDPEEPKDSPWSLPDAVELHEIQHISFRISRDSWEQADEMTRDIQSIASLLTRCGPHLQNIKISLQPPTKLEETPAGWTSKISWSLLRDQIRNHRANPHISFRIIGSYLTLPSLPLWNEKEATRLNQDFRYFVDVAKPTFTLVSWENDYLERVEL